MLKLLQAFFSAIRAVFLKGLGTIFSKMRDEKGDIKYFKDPATVKKVLMYSFFVLFIGVMGYKLLSSNITLVDGAKDHNQELQNKLGINAKEPQYDETFGDPLANLRNPEQKKELGGLTETKGPEDLLNPDMSVCNQLLDKLKGGAILNISERVQLRHCLENNTSKLNSEELTLAKMISAEGLSKQDKDKINDLFGSEKACKEEFDNQLTTSDGNEFINKLIDDSEYNQSVTQLLNDPTTLKKLLSQGNALKTQLGFSDAEISVLNKLLEKCSTSLLLKLLNDKDTKEAMKKLAKLAAENPNAIKGAFDVPNKDEKALLTSYLSQNTDPESGEDKLAKAMLGSDAAKKALAQDIIKAKALGDSSLASALMKKFNGEELTPEEQALIDKLNKDSLAKAYDALQSGDDQLKDAYLKKAKNSQLSGAEIEMLKNKDGLGISTTDPSELAKALNNDLTNRQQAIVQLKQDLANAQALAKLAAAKLARGGVLNSEEQDALQRFTDIQNKIKQLEDIQKARQQELGSVVTKLQGTIDLIGSTQKTLFPSGIEVMGFDYTKCKDIKPIKLVVKQKNKGTKPKKEELFVDSNGNPLTPDQIKILKAYRLQRDGNIAKFKQDKDRLINPLNGNGLTAETDSFLASNGLNNTRPAGGGNGGGGNIASLFISDVSSVQAFKLSPNQMIPGLLLTQILIQDKGNPQTVRVKILQDIYEPKSGKMVIPKNSIAIGKTSGFDVETGIMNLELTSVAVGGNTYDVNLAVNSADLATGLKGEVRDTRGKLLWGTFVSSFTAGALGALSSSYISTYTDSSVFSDQVIGSGLNGAAEVANKIATMYAGDLQNAARIYYVPSGVKVVLVPSN